MLYRSLTEEYSHLYSSGAYVNPKVALMQITPTIKFEAEMKTWGSRDIHT